MYFTIYNIGMNLFPNINDYIGLGCLQNYLYIAFVQVQVDNNDSEKFGIKIQGVTLLKITTSQSLWENKGCVISISDTLSQHYSVCVQKRYT